MSGHHKRKIVNLEDLKPAPYNPRQIDAASMAGLEESIDRFGLVQEIVVNERTGLMVGGHQRLKALREKGYKDAPVVFVDLDDSEEKALNIALNSRHISGVFTPDAQALLDDLAADRPDLMASLRLDKIAEDIAVLADAVADATDGAGDGTAGGEDDGGGELQEDPDSEPGRVYKLGPHRVLCGDSQDLDQVLLMMGDDRASLVVTDPPYNVASHSTNFAADLDGRAASYGALAESEWDHNWEFAPTGRVIDQVLSGDGACYVFTSHFLFGEISAWQSEAFDKSNYCVWSKPNPMPSLAKRHWTWATELVCYAARGRHVFNFPAEGHAPNVWTFPLQLANRSHPTQKPVEVMRHPIHHSSNRGDLVVDLFLGSGTTLIACAELGRVCYGAEMDPRFVDVIRKRWGTWARSLNRDPGPDAL